MVRGYILQTAPDEEECDPKDWIINCRNVETNVDQDIHTVVGDEPRGRMNVKEYRIDAHGDIWTDKITLNITKTR